MPTLLPRDDDNQPIPALRLRPGGAQALAAGAASVRSAAFAPGTRVVALYATGPVFLRSGDAAVAAGTGDHYFPAGTYYDLSLGAEKQPRHTHIAALAAEAPCTLYISEKE
ncbi:MAG TPA: hypothetical protein VEH84_11585 [Alphaproteobacteria bacterium]|nr:hypothetical protein [Alphaproteobacteria bacterium]